MAMIKDNIFEVGDLVVSFANSLFLIIKKEYINGQASYTLYSFLYKGVLINKYTDHYFTKTSC